jgi:hypothetical protein
VDSTMIFSLFALAIALVSLCISLAPRLQRERVQIEISRSVCLDAEGKERVSHSFSHGHPKTFLDRLRIRRARRRFDRLCRKDRNIA